MSACQIISPLFLRTTLLLAEPLNNVTTRVDFENTNTKFKITQLKIENIRENRKYPENSRKIGLVYSSDNNTIEVVKLG